MKKIFTIFILAVFLSGFSYSPFLEAEEIPVPTYDNSLIFSITHYFLNETTTEIDYIKNLFGNGMYAPLCFSKFEGVEMDWHIDIGNIGTGIQDFKDALDAMIVFAKQHKVGIHLTINYGMARLVHQYEDAKIEDIRNAQWYNDNNMSTSTQASAASIAGRHGGSGGFDLNHVDGANRVNDSLASPSASDSVINKYVFTTLSRYARKLQAHLDAKVTAAFAYLTQVQDANPTVTIIVSAPGEAELNFRRIQDAQYMQDYFCDYSPFAVLEFRDWVKHEGLYADGEMYAGEGYEHGGSDYQDAGGLSNFNSDFGTSFSSWDLKYYNWSLTDAVDSNYVDSTNPDPNIIPVSQYSQGGMMPGSGADYTAGGFDPPRVMEVPGTDDFSDLWQTFRQTMVYHYVKDMATIARDSGFDKDKYFSHQIPGDYLFGTRPNDPLIPYLNPRYYSSAAPMWTADVYSDIGLGVTLYDVNLLTWIARTTLYGVGGADALSDNWAALEYNPEVIPSTYIGSATLSGSSTHYSQMIRLYNGNPHVISFFKWKNQGGSDYQFKETNRGTALKQFFDAVKDKARQSVSTVFTPKEVENASVSYSTLTALVNLSWSEKIWTNKSYLWTDWGDFQEFVIYRGYSQDFTANTSAEIVRQSSATYIDTTFDRGVTVYYKIAAVNSNGVVGPVQDLSVDVPEGNPIPVMSVSRERMNFAFVNGGSNPPTQDYRISNNGTGALIWTAVDDAEWLTCDPDSGINGAVVTVTADPTGLAIGTYSGTITIDDPQATNSPQTITVYLTVKSANQNQLPFGDFSTPTDGSTVSSSVPVTGWVLDDVGVESVKIYRDPIEGEGTGIIYIGDALFVEGARSDIEAAYPDYPANYMAGWGYMLLTNFLPNAGNGTFTLFAIAKDTFGYEVTLGTKTITCDNANAVKPFGAIDSPAPGGTASGSNYRNNGWALTPMPNSIPTNSATLDVYIDGVNRGHPVYNVYRSDIAGLFAGYANSGGAGGYFDFDTHQFSDGIHTIAWIAEDFAGNSDGIGSRFFTVDNTGSSSRTTSTTSTPWAPDPKLLSTVLSKLPPDSTSPLGVVKGFKKNAEPRKNYPNGKGITNLRIKEMQRVEIHLDAGIPGKSLYWSGALMVNNNLRKLPVGSTLDAEKGIFYWQPGLAFMGNYTLEFVGFDNTTGKMKRKQVKITIVPGK